MRQSDIFKLKGPKQLTETCYSARYNISILNRKLMSFGGLTLFHWRS